MPSLPSRSPCLRSIFQSLRRANRQRLAESLKAFAPLDFNSVLLLIYERKPRFLYHELRDLETVLCPTCRDSDDCCPLCKGSGNVHGRVVRAAVRRVIVQRSNSRKEAYRVYRLRWRLFRTLLDNETLGRIVSLNLGIHLAMQDDLTEYRATADPFIGQRSSRRGNAKNARH